MVHRLAAQVAADLYNGGAKGLQDIFNEAGHELGLKPGEKFTPETKQQLIQKMTDKIINRSKEHV